MKNIEQAKEHQEIKKNNSANEVLGFLSYLMAILKFQIKELMQEFEKA